MQFSITLQAAASSVASRMVAFTIRSQIALRGAPVMTERQYNYVRPECGGSSRGKSNAGICGSPKQSSIPRETLSFLRRQESRSRGRRSIRRSGFPPHSAIAQGGLRGNDRLGLRTSKKVVGSGSDGHTHQPAIRIAIALSILRAHCEQANPQYPGRLRTLGSAAFDLTGRRGCFRLPGCEKMCFEGRRSTGILPVILDSWAASPCHPGSL